MRIAEKLLARCLLDDLELSKNVPQSVQQSLHIPTMDTNPATLVDVVQLKQRIRT